MARDKRQWDEHESNLHFAGMTREFIAAGVDGARPVIEAGLARMCRWSGCDRARFDLAPERPHEHGWSASSSTSPADAAHHITHRLMAEPEVHAWFDAALMRGDEFVVSASTPFPEEAAAERALFEESSIGTALFVPVTLDGRVVACLTLESADVDVVWPKDLMGRLRTMAEVYASVAQRAMTDQARGRAERRFEALAGFSHHIVCEFDGSGAMTFASPSTHAVLGIAPEEALGFGYLDLVHPEDRERAAAALVLNPGLTVEQLEIRLRRSDGEYLWMEAEGSSFSGAEGPRRVLAVLRDVTDHRERQAELKEHLSIEREVTRLSKEFVGLESASLDEAFRNALQASAGIADCDECYVVGVMEDLNAGVPEVHVWARSRQDLRHIDVDPQRIARYGWIYNELSRGVPVVVSDIEALPDEAAAERDELRQRGIGSYLALPLRDGSRTVGVLGFSTFGRKARWGDHQLMMLRLVAELFGAVFRRARTEAHVREREERFRVLADQSPDPIIELDDRGQILFASVDFAGLLGDPEEDWVGRYLNEFVVSEDLIRVNEVGDEAMGGRRVPPTVFQCRHQDGNPRFIEATVRSFETVKGARHGIATLRDVTAKLESQRTLEQQLTLERQIVQISSDFMGRRVDQLQDGVQRAMGIVAHLARADRCAVISFGHRPGAPNEIYQWAADGLPERDTPSHQSRPACAPGAHAGAAAGRAVLRTARRSHARLGPCRARGDAEPGPQELPGDPIHDPTSSGGGVHPGDGVAGGGVERRRHDDPQPGQRHPARRTPQKAARARARTESAPAPAVAEDGGRSGTLAGGIAHDFNNQLAVMLGNVRYVLDRQTESADSREALQDLERAADTAPS